LGQLKGKINRSDIPFPGRRRGRAGGRKGWEGLVGVDWRFCGNRRRCREEGREGGRRGWCCLFCLVLKRDGGGGVRRGGEVHCSPSPPSPLPEHHHHHPAAAAAAAAAVASSGCTAPG